MTIDLDKLTTERRNQKTFGLDEMSVSEAARLMNQEDHEVAAAVAKELPSIEPVIEAAIVSFKKWTLDLHGRWHKWTIGCTGCSRVCSYIWCRA